MSQCIRPIHNTASVAVILSTLLLSALLFFFPGSTLAADLFPRYPAIRNNVAFWEKIYSTYSVNTAVIHDRDDLSKIYEVVPLLDRNLPSSNRINQAVVKLTLEKYQSILENLSTGKAPTSVAEQKVATMFKGAQARRRMARAADAVRSQTGLKERFYEGVIRSGGYMDEIKRIFRAHGLPAELAYLPHVESSFNTEAYSKAGASGIWQFTKSTGLQYMQINNAIDERSDPFIAAEAAARYLQNSYRKLGSWPLALTSYNYGTAGMMRAQDAKGSYEKIFSEYREGYFGFASQNFYSEFLAAMAVAKKWEASQNIRRDRPVQFTEYKLPGYIHINDVRRHFRISDSTLKKLNPAIRPMVYSGEKLLPRGYPLRLPPQKNIRTLISSLPRSHFAGNQKQDKMYKVKPGESLGRIAARHGISLSSLLAANDLKRDAKILVGQRLRIPYRTSKTSASNLRPHLATTDTIPISAAPKSHTVTTVTQQPPRVLSAKANKIQRSASR